tara:strand:+ start:826 stop:1068 length:243 start_codon:yes stop_codon:yes gene_type:complete
MAELLNDVLYESLWHTSMEYRISSTPKKELIATSFEIIYRKEFGNSPPYVNKEEGSKHGFPQGYLGYPKDFVAKHIEQFL